VKELGDLRWEASILHQLASVHMLRDSYAEATHAANAAASIYQDLKDKHNEAMAMNFITQVALAKNDMETAAQTAQEQRAMFQEAGDKSKEASCLLTIASIWGSEEKYDDAMAVAKEAQELFQDQKDKSGEARSLNVMCEIHCDQKDFETAIDMAKEMRSKVQETGNLRSEVDAVRALVNVCMAADMAGEAVRGASEAVQLAKKTHDKKLLSESFILSSEANIALAIQDNPKGLAKGSDRSLKPAREAFKVAKAMRHGQLMGSAMHQIAYVQLVTVKLDDALKSAKEALDIFRQVDERVKEAATVILIAEIHHSANEDDKALDAANEGLMLAKACGDPKKEKEANDLVEKIAGKRMVYQPMYMDPSAMAAAPGQEQAAAAPADQAASLAEAKQVGLDAAMVSATVVEMAKAAVGTDDDDLFLDSALMDSGMDSLTAVSFRNGLQQNLGVKLPSSLMFDYPTMKEITNRIVELSIENP